MRGAPLKAALGCVALVLLVAGCTDTGRLEGRTFDALPAPHWLPGYTWTYATHVSSSEAGLAPDDGTPGKVTLTVTNTTSSIDGAPVYVLRVDGPTDGMPLWDGQVIALTQAHLNQVASGGSPLNFAPHTMPAMAMEDAGGMRMMAVPTMGSACTVVTLRPTPSDRTVSLVHFPLEKTSSWSGSVSDAGPAGSYVARVVGMDTVTVPAGTFDAVHVSLGFAPMTEDGGSLSVKVDAWYSARAEYLVKIAFTVNAAQLFPQPGGMSFTSTTELQSYTLSAGLPQPAPKVAQPEVLTKALNLNIVSDQEFPLDLTNGSKTVRFGLDVHNQVPHVHVPAGSIVAHQAPTVADYDHDLYEAQWTLNGPVFRSGTGDVFTVDLPGPGLYNLYVQLRSRDCTGSGLGSGSSIAPAFWQKTWDVQVRPGSPGTSYPVGDLPLDRGYSSFINVSWSYAKHTADAAPDGGEPILTDPAGHAVHASSDGNPRTFQVVDLGQYHLSWMPESAPLGPTAMPIVWGDPVHVTARVDYVKMWPSSPNPLPYSVR